MSASENITDNGRTRLRGLLDAGDPYGDVRDAWHAKETLRSIYDIADADLGAATVDQLAQDLQDPAMPPEINLWVPINRSWALTRGFALHPGTTRFGTRGLSIGPHRGQANDHGRVSGTHVCPEGK